MRSRSHENSWRCPAFYSLYWQHINSIASGVFTKEGQHDENSRVRAEDVIPGDVVITSKGKRLRLNLSGWKVTKWLCSVQMVRNGLWLRRIACCWESYLMTTLTIRNATQARNILMSWSPTWVCCKGTSWSRESDCSRATEHRKAYANTAATKDGWISCSDECL